MKSKAKLEIEAEIETLRHMISYRNTIVKNRKSLIKEQTDLIRAAKVEIERVVKTCTTAPSDIDKLNERIRLAAIKLNALNSVGTASLRISKAPPTDEEKLIAALAEFKSLKKQLKKQGLSEEQIKNLLDENSTLS